MYTAMIPQTTLHRQEAAPPPQWSIYAALSADELIALRAAGVRISGNEWLARLCPQCGRPGEVGVTETTLADGIAFIARDGWTCIECRRAETAHWIASPKPAPASRGGSSGRSTLHAPRSTSKRRSTQATNATRKQRAVNAAWKLYHDACDVLEDIADGRIPVSATDAATKQRNKAWHTLARYGVVRGQEVAS
jgi:hypothetical protein